MVSNKCVDHLNYSNEICPGCNLLVNEYGNTEETPLDYCSFPHCGCDGERNCPAEGGSNNDSKKCNLEGMWESNSKDAKKAVLNLISLIN